MLRELIGNTDASGETGRRVAERVARAGLRQRSIVQDGGQPPDLPNSDVRRISGYEDVEALTAALVGVQTLLLMPIKERPDRARLHCAAVDAALAAGVNRIIYSSFLAAAPNATFTLARDHYATEEYIKVQSIPFTFVRGSAYLEVLHQIIGADRVIRGPAGDGRLAPVGRDDLADTLAAILMAPGAHDGQTYDVTGPEALSLQDVAAEFSRASGRVVVYEDETLEQACTSRRAYGAPDWQVEAWVSTYLQIANGELDVVSDTVLRLTGHPALSLREYLARHPEDYRQLMQG